MARVIAKLEGDPWTITLITGYFRSLISLILVVETRRKGETSLLAAPSLLAPWTALHRDVESSNRLKIFVEQQSVYS